MSFGLFSRLSSVLLVWNCRIIFLNKHYELLTYIVCLVILFQQFHQAFGSLSPCFKFQLLMWTCETSKIHQERQARQSSKLGMFPVWKWTFKRAMSSLLRVSVLLLKSFQKMLTYFNILKLLIHTLILMTRVLIFFLR